MKRLFLAVIAVLLICLAPATAGARFMQGPGPQQPVQPLRFDKSDCKKPLEWLLGADCVEQRRTQDANPARQECRKGPIDIHVFRRAGIDGHIRICKDLFLQVVPLTGADRLEIRRVTVDPVSGWGHYVRIWSDGGLKEFRLPGSRPPSFKQKWRPLDGWHVLVENPIGDYGSASDDGYDFVELASTALLMFWLGGLLALYLVIRRISSLYRDNAQVARKIRRKWNYIALAVVLLTLLYIAVSDIFT